MALFASNIVRRYFARLSYPADTSNIWTLSLLVMSQMPLEAEVIKMYLSLTILSSLVSTDDSSFEDKGGSLRASAKREASFY